MGAHPYFRSDVRSFAADSSRKTNWRASKPARVTTQASLRTSSRSAARFCAYVSVILRQPKSGMFQLPTRYIPVSLTISSSSKLVE